MADYLPRVVDRMLGDRLASAGAVLVEGPKACGKTFTATQVAVSQTRLDIDRNAREALRIDPSLVLNDRPPQLVDEWQLEADAVWNYVRFAVDQRGVPGQFVLTGSAVPDDDALVVRGGWPLNLGMTVRSAARANLDYLDAVAEVDIPRLDRAQRDPARTGRFLRALARNTAMEQKVARLAAEVGADGEPLARTTAYDYMRALRRLMILDEVPAWATHLRSRAVLRTAPRTHLADPSLAAAALGAGPERLLSDLNTLGLLFESLVVRDTRVYAGPLDATVHHYRDSLDLEVDVVVQCRDGRWGAVEVKLGTGQVDEAAAHLRSFARRVDTTKVGEPAVLAVVTATGYGYTRPDGVVVVPVGAFGP